MMSNALPPPNQPPSAETADVGTRLVRLAGACRALAPGREGELDRLTHAVAFGHVPGQPGWPSLRTDLAAALDGADGAGSTGPAYRAVVLAGVLYADALLGEPSLDPALRAAEIEIGAEIMARQAIVPPLLDPEAEDAPGELQRGGDTLAGRHPGANAVAEWLRRTGERLGAVGDPPDYNAVELVLDTLDFDPPLPASEAARAGARAVLDARELVVRDLERRGVALLAPLPGERLNGAEHAVVGDPGARVGRLNRVGFRIRNGAVRHAAVTAVD